MPLGGALSAGGAVVGSLINGIFGSSAAAKAAAQQRAAQQQVINTTSQAVSGGQAGVGANVGIANDLLQGAQAGYQPYTDAGTASLAQEQQLVGAGGPLDQQFSFNPSDLQNDPGYAFTLQQGQQAIQRAAAAKGGLFSSGTLKSLAGYTTGTANQYFNDAYNRALNTFTTNRSTALSRIGTLQGLANLGYSGTGAVAGLKGQQAANSISGAEYGSNLGLQGAQIIGGALTGQGNAAAAGTVGGYNALSSGIGNATNSIDQYLTLRNLKNIFPSGGGSPTNGLGGAAYNYPQPVPDTSGGSSWSGDTP